VSKSDAGKARAQAALEAACDSELHRLLLAAAGARTLPLGAAGTAGRDAKAAAIGPRG
jgi:hypothetical protein